MRLVTVLALVVCAGPVAAQSATAPTSFPAGLYQPGDPAPQGSLFSFESDGTFEVSAGLHVIASGQFASTARHLVLMFEADDETCARLGANTGIYSWAETDGAIALTAVDDACEGRAQALSSALLAPQDGGGE
ncbi:MAG: hypothetical protein AAGK21_03110 [Bacteroidota bacterium]